MKAVQNKRTAVTPSTKTGCIVSTMTCHSSLPATFLILESERTHPQAVSSSCFIVDSQRTGTFGSALPFRSHINSPGILRPAVATLQDGQLMPREAGEAVLLRTTANSRPRSNLYP